MHKPDLIANPPSEKTATELLDGHEWIPLFGLSAGVTAHTKHLTLTVAVYGLELFPGAYKGLPRAIYWPR